MDLFKAASPFSKTFLSNANAAYTALRGDSAQLQTARDTIEKLVSRISGDGSEIEDRRASVMSLKALARDWKADVGIQALPALITVLQLDAPHDVEIAKACLETLTILCETDANEENGGKLTRSDLGLVHTDILLQEAEPLHNLLALLAQQNFYIRFFTLQLLSTLLLNRPNPVQSSVLVAPGGLHAIMECLGEKREILRNEALLLLHNLTVSNADLQKLSAFDGAFERLLDIVVSEGGIEGGIVVQDCLAAVGTLLRFNASNQNYFRELSQIPRLAPLLLFPSPPPSLTQPAPDEFALQYWPEQKIINASLVTGLVRLLVSSSGSSTSSNNQGNQNALLASGMTRCLLELAMASNAPTSLKAEALFTLSDILRNSTPNQELLSSLKTTPLIPLPADDPEADTDQGVGYTRLSSRPATVILVALAVHGEVPGEGSWSGPGLKLRKAASRLFESYVSTDHEIKLAIVKTMNIPIPSANPNPPPAPAAATTTDGAPVEPPEEEEKEQSAGSLLLSALTDFPSSSLQVGDGHFYDPYRPLFASFLFSHLLRNSEAAKKLAREVSFANVEDAENGDVSEKPDGDDDDDDEKVTLMQLLVGNLMMAAREQSEASNKEAKEGTTKKGAIVGAMTTRDWTRAIVGYLVALCTWLWDSPRTVREFLMEGTNLHVLIQPITQPTNLIDPLIPGLSAFLLGVCYEFNREPGEITRSTLYPILHTRIGPDQFVSRMARVRDDVRFKTVGPDDQDDEDVPEVSDDGAWLDWDFVDFWKNNYYTIQRSINADPEASTRPAADDSESASLIAELRRKIKSQADELENLNKKFTAMNKEHEEDRTTLATEVTALSEHVGSLSSEKDALSDQIKTLVSEKTTALAEKETLATQLKALETEKASSSGDAASASKEKKALQDKLEALASSVVMEKKTLQEKLDALTASTTEEKQALQEKVAALTAEVEASKKKSEENEKEQEDLLVLLEELSTKRKADKAKMKAKDMDVSEDEDEGDGDDDDDEDDS